MTKKEFDELFERCRKQYTPSNEAELGAKLKHFADKKGNVTPQALALFTYVETIQYTNDMLYSVLSEALDVKD